MSWYVAVLKKYAIFNGRSQRAEYWMFALFNVIISFLIGTLEALLDIAGTLTLLYSLAILVPAIAVTVRRLHDTDRSGWWILIAFVPVIGFIVLLIFMVLDSTPGRNRFGPSPKQIGAAV